jgi:hypothetical protein
MRCCLIFCFMFGISFHTGMILRCTQNILSVNAVLLCCIYRAKMLYCCAVYTEPGCCIAVLYIQSQNVVLLYCIYRASMLYCCAVYTEPECCIAVLYIQSQNAVLLCCIYRARMFLHHRMLKNRQTGRSQNTLRCFVPYRLVRYWRNVLCS